MSTIVWRPCPFTLISFGILVADQGLDLLIEATLPAGASAMLIPERLGVRRLAGPNPATLDTNAFFVVLTLITMPFLWWYTRKIHPDTSYRVAVTMLLGGLLGHLADGLRVGFPVDYLVVGRACNLADVAVILGGVLLISQMLRRATGTH